ncbi:methyltransferase domain-containing protein [uncultured Desulfobulbus sp.]|uniref:class I SAM-dependent methyltransferase n=1 Tax=uncultured Desulfobulbus sp. TaxID=239745 RepID=UPI0029C8C19E|nr:methyltransferase domain-containing protein [uncultured Desulfobulbus sp.]
MAHEFDGKGYSGASTHQKEWGSQLINELALQGHEHILDLGCGDGVLTKVLADLVPRGEVIGVDASRGMLEAAQSKTCGNLQFLLMDIDDIDFLDRFDIIFSNAALHWVKGHERLFSNVYRALRNGGRIRFNFASDGNCAHFFKVVREAMARDEFQPSFVEFIWPWYMPTLDDYHALVDEIGFDNALVWEENADRFFSDELMMVRWIDQPSLVPFLPFLTGQQQKDFRDYVVQRMIEETRQHDGRCFETFRRMNVSACK